MIREDRPECSPCATICGLDFIRTQRILSRKAIELVSLNPCGEKTGRETGGRNHTDFSVL